MKKKHSEQVKTTKKPNIPLRRKIRIYTSRASLIFKVIICIFLYFLFFTERLDSLKRWVAYQVYEYTADNGLKLEKVMIEGQKNILADEIVSTLNADVGTSILSIKLDRVREALEINDWIEHVAVERRLPHTIYVGISEREPIAILQQNKKLYLVDKNAHIIPYKDLEKFAGLLHVVGSDAHIHAAELLQDLNADAELQKKVCSAVRYGERRWNLILDQSITAKMPERDFAKAYNYLSELNKSDKLFGKNFKVIDLRDSTKYYFEKYPEAKEDKRSEKGE